MSFNILDRLFHMASHGNKEAEAKLYEEFVKQANMVIAGVIKNNTNFRGFSGDFCDIIDELYFKATNQYEGERGSFSTFVNWLFNSRLKNAVLKEIIDIKSYTKTFSCDDEEYNEIENIPDSESLSISNQIALDNFELRISSRDKHNTSKERTKRRVLLLYYAGYSLTEISKILKIPYTTLKRILDAAIDDDNLSNINFDLK